MKAKANFQNRLNKVKRNFAKSKRKSTSIISAKSKNKSSRSANNKINRKLVVLTVGIVVLVIIIYITYYYISLYNKIDLKEYDGDKYIKEMTWNDSNDFNLFFLITDQKDSGHNFIDRAFIINFEKDIKLINVFAINTSTVLGVGDEKKMLKNVFLDEHTISELIFPSERLLGLQIDRYMIVSEEGILSVFEKLGFESFVVEDLIDDPDFDLMPVGYKIDDAFKLYNYLGSEYNGDDVQMRRLVDFVEREIESMGFFSEIINMSDWIEVLNNSTYTNISKSEFIDMFLFARNLRKDQIKVGFTRNESFINSNSINQKLLPVYSQLDNDLKSIFANNSLALEQATIELLNATTKAGVASKISRFIENAGARVAKVGNSAIESETNKIYVDNLDKYPNTIKEIQNIFENDIEIIEEEYKFRQIGDIVIIIGKDTF